jgi:uncharacterized protein (DUF433 family)
MRIDREYRMNLPEFLTRDPDGEIRLTGHRIGLYTVVRVYDDGLSPEEIHEQFPTLEAALVREVIAFYLDHRTEVVPYVAEYRADLERQAAMAPKGPSHAELRRRRQERRRAEAP